MAFNSFTPNAKISGVKSYSTSTPNTANIFERAKQIASNMIDEIDYSNYEAVGNSVSEQSNNSNYMDNWVEQNRNIIDRANNLLKTIRNIMPLYTISPILHLIDGLEITIEGDIITIEKGGTIYRYRNGLCFEIEYETGVFALIKYDSNGEPCGISYSYNKNGQNESLKIFGDNNIKTEQYGGNQGVFGGENANELLQDPIILDMLRSAYPDASMEDYQYYLNAFCSVGCGYIAFVNMIFKYYEGREEDFERAFGFPMYSVDKNGNVDYNYEYLALELCNYVWCNSGYTIQELYGDIGKDAKDGALSKEEMEKVMHGTHTWESIGNGSYDHLMTYFVMQGIDIQMNFYNVNSFKNESGNFSPEIFLDFIKQQLEHNNSIIVSAKDFDLHSIDGNLSASDVGPHAMSVVGVTDNGIIVSSWGKQYLIKTEELENIYQVNVFDFNNDN